MPNSPPSQLDIGLTPYKNRGIFADHFLKTRLNDLTEWHNDDGLADAFKAVLALFHTRGAKFSPAVNEAQTEEDFVRPVLDILWGRERYQTQVTIPNVDARRQPDYALFTTAADRDAAHARLGTAEYWKGVPCLGDAKRWTASLDMRRAADDNPSAQICNYLYRSGVRWGILTNGRVWRLYERERSSKGGTYFEVDLEHVLIGERIEDFKYFFHFFRREAHVVDAQGNSFLAKVLEGSSQYAAEVGNKLKESVYDALRRIMNGILTHSDNGLDSSDPKTLKEVHENALIVLYRLLFILYAEDRGLLPCDRPHYREYSLQERQKQIHSKLSEGKRFLSGAGQIWRGLLDQFRLIDEGIPEDDVPAFNGGLFSPEKHQRVSYSPRNSERWEIGDKFLAESIDLLAYERRPGKRAWAFDPNIDYASLAVQHLGSIYEGLLELQPRVAAEPLVEVIDDGKQVFKPAREVPSPRNVRGLPPKRVGSGEVYLVTDRGERKATGSYYTPKYIVDYIVQNTIGPLTDEAAAAVEKLRPETDAEIARLVRNKDEWAGQAAPGDEATLRQVENIERHIEEQKLRLMDPYLNLKALDPAMGSGHFLVDAADFLSLAMATDPNLLPPEAVNGDDPQAYYKRLVVQRCLYGVDLNPLAVELAKLSLWLHTVSSGRALSFLDHHLRCGNSLIGARIEADLMHPPPRMNAKGKRVKDDSAQVVMGFAEALTATHLRPLLDTFRQIVESPGGSAEREHAKDKLYFAMDAGRDRYRAVANIWLAPYFGVPVLAEQYERAVQALQGTDQEWAALGAEDWFADAQGVARERRYFHWELEFPEAFFEAKGFKAANQSGFDAVIGNPPYIRVRALKDLDALSARFYEESGSYEFAVHVWDVYMLIVERTSFLSRKGGACGFIVPIQTLHQPNSKELRRWLLAETKLENVLDLSQVDDVFEEAIVKTCVLIYAMGRPNDDHEVRVTKAGGDDFHEVWRAMIPQIHFTIDETFSLKPDSIGEAATVIAAAKQRTHLLSDYCYVTFGLRSCAKGKGQGDKNRLILTSEAVPEARRYLEGREISRYNCQWQGRFIRYMPEEMYSPRVPELFETEKIVSQSMLSSKRLIATFDDASSYVEQSLVCTIPHGVLTPPSNLLPVSLPYILALFNSKLLSFYFAHKVIGDSLGGGLIHATPGSVGLLPIREISYETPDAERKALVDRGRQSLEGSWTAKDTAAALEFISLQLIHVPEHSDVVHDLLAYLAEQMIAMNREKQKETRGFLTWLEREIGVPIEGLANKTRLKEYHEYDLDSLLGVLRQNRAKIALNPDVRSTQELLQNELEASIARLTPLKQRLQFTDDLIDEIVYKLYGLTDEEIAIVKGTGTER